MPQNSQRYTQQAMTPPLSRPPECIRVPLASRGHHYLTRYGHQSGASAAWYSHTKSDYPTNVKTCANKSNDSTTPRPRDCIRCQETHGDTHKIVKTPPPHGAEGLHPMTKTSRRHPQQAMTPPARARRIASNAKELMPIHTTSYDSTTFKPARLHPMSRNALRQTHNHMNIQTNAYG